RRLALGGWGGLLAATLATLLLQGPYGYGLGLGAALSSGMIASTLDLPLGAALAGRVLLLGVIVVYLGELVGRLPGMRRPGSSPRSRCPSTCCTCWPWRCGSVGSRC
ncbi:MAG: hypothetical protein ACRDTF_10195, partial [Pseudonocardiaceae bacterium]